MRIKVEIGDGGKDDEDRDEDTGKEGRKEVRMGMRM